jgi:hypothetical protein
LTMYLVVVYFSFLSLHVLLVHSSGKWVKLRTNSAQEKEEPAENGFIFSRTFFSKIQEMERGDINADEFPYKFSFVFLCLQEEN